MIRVTPLTKFLLVYILILPPLLFFEYGVVPRLHDNDLLLLSHEEGVSSIDSFLRSHLGYGISYHEEESLPYHFLCSEKGMYHGNFLTRERSGSLCGGEKDGVSFTFGWLSLLEVKAGNSYLLSNQMMEVKNKKEISCTREHFSRDIYKIQSSVHQCHAFLGDGREDYFYSFIYLYPAKIKSIVSVIVVGGKDKNMVQDEKNKLLQKITPFARKE